MNELLHNLFQRAKNAGWNPPEEWIKVFPEELEIL